MNIEWKGEGCFDIRAIADKVSIMTQYPDRESGLTAPRSKPDIYISTIGDLEDTLFSDQKEDRFLISGPGEYEVKEVFISGLKSSFEGTMMKMVYIISMEGMKIGYLGNASKEDITPEVIGFLEGVDILIIPVGGGDVLSAGEAAKVVNQTEPKIVIPAYYKIKGLKTKREDLDVFLKEVGSEKVEPEKKLLVKKKDINFEGMKVIPLSSL